MTSPISPMAGIDLQALAMAIVLRAPKLKSPVLGIPRPGFPPLAFNREIIANCVRGLTVTRVEWNEQLIIEGTREHGRGCYKLNPLQVDYLLRERVTKWATQQRNNGMLSGGERQRVKGSKYAIRIRDTKAAIAKLEARMSGRCHRWRDRIIKPRVPQNPLLTAELTHYADWARRDTLRWYTEKPQRKVISRIKSIHRGDKTLVGFYKAMAAAGFPARQYSKVKHIRKGEAWPTYCNYLDQIHEYTGLARKPKHTLEPYVCTVGTSYGWKMEYIADLRAWQSAQQELAGLRELLASYEQDAAQDA